MQNKTTFFLGLGAALLLGFFCWYLFGSGAGNSNNVDNRLSNFEERLSAAEAEQRKASAAIDAANRTAAEITATAGAVNAGLDRATETARRGQTASESAAESVREATAAANDCARSVEDSRSRFAECESIFNRIDESNQRGKSGGKTEGITH